jgi:type I restriction enzyme, S subunit
MRLDWIRTTLGNLQAEGLADLQTGPFGTVLKASEYSDKGVPVISVGEIREGFIQIHDRTPFVSSDVTTKLSKYVLKEGDIVFGRKGSIERNAIINKDQDGWFLGSDGIRLRLKKSINCVFLSYQLRQKSFQKWLMSNGVGSTMPSLNQKILDRLPIWLPAKNEQDRIAEILSLLDSKIELNNRINAELEAIAKLVYEYWFVQFDFPISTEQAEKMGDPTLVGKPYKSSGGKMVWDEVLKREIPEGWEVKSMDYWIEKDKNGDWGKEEIEGNYDLRVSCIRGADINGLNGNGEIKCPVRYILEKNSHKILEPGDLVIEISGGSPVQSTGRLGYIINETLERFNEPIICSNFCKAITLKEESNLFNFIYEWKRLYDAGIFFGYEGKTSGIKNFLFESFVSKHKIVIPPQELTEKFYEKVLPIHSKIQKNLTQNQQLSSLRDWLLPMLMNGQVTVAEAEEWVEEELGMVAEEREKYSNN